MNYDDLKAAVEVKQQKIAEATEDLQKVAGQYFRDLFEDLFKKYNIENIRWQQYTPYFNDGEDCEFGTRINKNSIYINGEEAWDREDNDPLKEAYEPVAALLNSFSDEEFLEYFGDHAQVTLTPTSLTVEEYEHE